MPPNGNNNWYEESAFDYVESVDDIDVAIVGLTMSANRPSSTEPSAPGPIVVTSPPDQPVIPEMLS